MSFYPYKMSRACLVGGLREKISLFISLFYIWARNAAGVGEFWSQGILRVAFEAVSESAQLSIF